MKDITIKLTARRLRFELISFLVCFLIGFGINVGAIIAYEASAWELLTSIFYVLTFALALYVAWILLRLVIYGIRCTLHKTSKP